MHYTQRLTGRRSILHTDVFDYITHNASQAVTFQTLMSSLITICIHLKSISQLSLLHCVALQANWFVSVSPLAFCLGVLLSIVASERLGRSITHVKCLKGHKSL